MRVVKTTRGQFIKKIIYKLGTPTLEKCGNPHIRGRLSSMVKTSSQDMLH
jgi:hypothetical protein